MNIISRPEDVGTLLFGLLSVDAKERGVSAVRPLSDMPQAHAASVNDSDEPHFMVRINL